MRICKRGVGAALLSVGLLAAPSAATAHDHLKDGFSSEKVESRSCRRINTRWQKRPYDVRKMPGPGKFYIEMKRDVVKDITKGKASGAKTMERLTMTATGAQRFKKEYESVAAGRNVAAAGVAAMLTAIPGLGRMAGVLPKTGGVLGDGATYLGLMEAALDKSNTGVENVSLDQLAVLFAKDGKIVHVFKIWRRSRNEPWITFETQYRVNVQSEARAYLLCAWSYPLKIVS